MDENEDIRMVKKRLLVDTIRDEGRVCGKILASLLSTSKKVAFKRKEKPRYGFSGFINSRVN